MSIQRICDVLQPLFDLGDIRDHVAATLRTAERIGALLSSRAVPPADDEARRPETGTS